MSSEHEFQVTTSTSPTSSSNKDGTSSIQNHLSSSPGNLIIGLEDAIDQTGSYIYIKDMLGRYVYANNKVRKLFNAPLGDIVGKDDSHFFNITFAKDLLKDDLRVLVHGETIEKEETLWVKSIDENRIFLVVKKPILNIDGKIIGLCGVSTDITEIKRTNDALRKSEELYRNTFQTSLDAININRMNDGVYINVNDAFLNILGFARDEVIGRSSLGLNIWVDTSERQRLIETLKRNSDCPNLETRFRCKNGNIIWGLMSASIILIDDEPCILSITRDITDRKLAERELRLAQFTLDQAPDAVYRMSSDGRFLYVNETASRSLGYSVEELLTMSVANIDLNLPFGDLPKLVQATKDAGIIRMESAHRSKDGHIFPVEVVVSYIEYEGKDYHCSFVRDITERKLAEENLKITASVFEISQEAIIITDGENKILDVNPAFIRITGYSRDEVIGTNPKLLSSGKQDKNFYARLWKSINENGSWQGEIWNRRKSGDIYPEMLSISVLRDSEGKIIRHVAVFSDISKLKEHEAELVRVAHFDALTSIPNRILLADRMKQAILQTPRDQCMMGVCYLDLDGFKPINDALGHQAGDEVLIEIARRISATIRGGDTVARLGGDEFVVLLLGLSKGEECVATLERLLAAIAEPIKVKERTVNVSASIGVSIYPLDEEDPDTLLRHADQAMYVAKQSGKNRFHIYDIELDKRARDQNEFLKSIRHALEHNQFELHYQPKVNLRTKKLVGAEALIRWRHPERGLLLPAEFLRHVENTDIDIQIGEWVTANALAQLHRWRSAGLDIEVSINISGYHMESEGFVDKLQQQLANYPNLPNGKLQIEVLETVALNDIIVVQGIIESCRKIGIGFALDDFGTGYSSLSYLSALPVDTLKIDQSFVRDMLTDKGDMAIVQGIIALAKAFKRETVAEGIETDEHYQALLDMNCEIGQGYGISRPMPASEVIKWKSNYR